MYDPARDRLFFKRRNGMRIDAIRQQMQLAGTGAINDVEMSALLAPLVFGKFCPAIPVAYSKVSIRVGG